MTILDRFKFENHDYVIEMQNNNFIVFYRESFNDPFNAFAEPTKSSSITNDIKNPIALLRMISSKVKQYLYANNIRYFYLTVDDPKRKRLYLKFLDNLVGYSYQVTGDTINIFSY